MYLKFNLVLVLILFVANCTIADTAALNGSGTQTDPYLIQNVDDFLILANPDNSFLWQAGVHIRLDSDINLKSIDTFSQAPISGDLDDDSGYDGIRFSAVFYGNNKTISNLTVSCPSYAGLFGVIGRGGSVSDLTLANADISCDGYYGGSLCGYNYGSVTNCVTKGFVTGSAKALYVGGLCGYSEVNTIISNSSAFMTVTGKEFIGILCGRNSGEVIDCFTDGTVSGLHFVGGLCGRNSGSIDNSFSTGDATGTGVSNSIGGFCGHNSGSINSCYSTGNISGRYYLGGFCGYNNGGIINFCYTIGTVSGDAYLGGLIGFNSSGSISECLSTGDVSGDSYYGGLCGFNSYGSISDSFWNIESSAASVGYNQSSTKQGNETNVQGLTTAQMYDINTYLDAGWDFVHETSNGSEDLWHMPYDAAGYPILVWQKDIPGDLTGKYGVDLEDFAAVSQSWLNDYNMTDLHTLAQYWLEGIE